MYHKGGYVTFFGRAGDSEKRELFGVSNLAPVSRETSYGTSRLENRAATHQQKNFGQRWYEPDQYGGLFVQ